MPVQFEIHPSIGVARLGTSEEHFLGPGPGVTAPASYRDAGKRLKKQAARFQVFRCDRDPSGKLLSAPELITPAKGTIKWTVEVANRKAAAFKLTDPAKRRNNAKGNDTSDAELLIRPAAKTVDASMAVAIFDDGKFRGRAVPLGRAMFQTDGSLVITGGNGDSGKAPETAPDLKHFADNNGWFDDTCDGPVRAQVTLPAGTTHEAIAARVVVGPPDFAPEVQPWITLYDIAYQAAIDRGFLAKETKPSYARFIRPLFARAKGFAWVTERAGTGHGGGASGNFSDARLAQLGNPAGPAAIRNGILGRFRDPANPVISDPSAMPRLFSEEGYLEKKFKVLALPPIFYSYMKLWAAGSFVGDNAVDPFAAESIVDTMDRMAMEACVGGGFFPGIEVPRFVRDKAVWVAAFRLDPAIPAGMVTAGLAVPWQADFSACTWEGASPNDPQGHGWWPAQRPDHVFASAHDADTGTRSDWDRGAESAPQMIAGGNYSKLGIVRRVGDFLIETERAL